MTFDLLVVVGALLLPGGVALVSLGLATWTAGADPQGRHLHLASLICGVGWWLAIAGSLWFRNGWEWPDPAWRAVIWPLLVSALLAPAVLTERRTDRSGGWVAVALLAIATAWVAMPSGDSWTDIVPSHRDWVVVVAGFSLLNGWSLHQIERTGGKRFALWVAVAGIVGPTVLAATSFASLAEWTVSALTATTVFAAARTSFPNRFGPAVAVGLPAVAFATAAAASGRFYCYQTHPIWLYAIILGLPCAVGLLDHCLGRRLAAHLRLLIAGAFAVLGLSIAIWFLLGR